MIIFRLIASLIAVLGFVAAGRATAEISVTEAARLLPDKIESLQASGPAQPLSADVFKGASELSLPLSAAMREYASEAGANLSIAVVKTERESAAYALLTQLTPSNESIKTDDVGIGSVISSNRTLFYKGDTVVEIRSTKGDTTRDQLLAIARFLAGGIPNGDDEIPILVKHLPSGQTSGHSSYAVSLSGLKGIVPNQPILDTVDFEGGTEAVAANYGQTQLVIIEFPTPQFAGDNDRAIIAKVQELRSQSQPVPTAYRRVGNYSVFVFNAADEKTANDLIDQVKYQKVVQWLGEDPHLYEKLEKYFAQTSAGVLIAVLESSGLSLLICFGLGTLFGTLLFRYRRVQRATRYSDAGGTVRLNLDELTAHDNSRGLLKSPSPRESPSKHS